MTLTFRVEPWVTMERSLGTYGARQSLIEQI